MQTITIGRLNTNDVTITDASVSREHAQIIRFDNGTYSITDLNTLNGTYVNGQRIYGTMLLHETDSVRVGETNLPWQQYFKDSKASERVQAGGGGAQVYVQNIQNVGANYDPQPESQGANVFAILGFIFAFFIPLLGVIFSAIGISKANKMGGKQKGLAITGLILSIIFIVAVIIVYSIFFAAIGTLGAMSF